MENLEKNKKEKSYLSKIINLEDVSKILDQSISLIEEGERAFIDDLIERGYLKSKKEPTINEIKNRLIPEIIFKKLEERIDENKIKERSDLYKEKRGQFGVPEDDKAIFQMAINDLIREEIYSIIEDIEKEWSEKGRSEEDKKRLEEANENLINAIFGEKSKDK